MSKATKFRPRKLEKEKTYPVLTGLDFSMGFILRLSLMACCFALMSVLLLTRGQHLTRYASEVADQVVKSLSRPL